MKSKKYLTSKELAAHFGVTPSRVRQWVYQGCPCINPALKSQFAYRQQLIFKVADVERWLASFTQPEPQITQLTFNY